MQGIGVGQEGGGAHGDLLGVPPAARGRVSRSIAGVAPPAPTSRKTRINCRWTDTGEANLRDEVLEAGALLRRGTRQAEILVDDPDAVARPAQRHRPLDEAVLQVRALAMAGDLPERGLPHVDVGETGLLGAGDRGARVE